MYTIFTDRRKQDQIYSSDSDVTQHSSMAGDIFDEILSSIKNSKLNFQLQLSPFTAYISLKKSFVRDKSGKVVVPSEPLFLNTKK